MTTLPLLLSLVAPAHAYKLSGYMWPADAMPVQYWITDYLEDSLPQTPDPVTGLYYQEQVIMDSFDNWKVAECAAIQYEYMGIDPGNEGPRYDGINKVYFDDPIDDQGAGVNAYMSRQAVGSTVLKEVGGQLIYDLIDADIMFNDNIDWGTSEDIEAGCQANEMAIESTATHEIGHFWGLGHSCDQEDICTDPALEEATMYWTGGPCDLSRASPEADDIEGMTALYGPFATFKTDSDRFGAAPLTVEFQVVTDEEITRALWNFGDGTTSTEVEPVHTYTTQGQFTVTAELGGTSEVCGDWDFTYSELAYILVCETPDPAFSAEPSVLDEGFVYQMINETGVSTYGCVDEVGWEVYRDGQLVDTCAEAGLGSCPTIAAWAPKITFPSEGTYRVVLNAAGPAGDAQAELVLDVSATGTGCSTGGAAPAALLALAGLGAALRRRREP